MASVFGTPNAAAATTVTIPTHVPGDMIIIFAYRDGSTTIPTQPAASGTVPTWNIITNNTGANTNSSRVSWALATASNHTSGTWTNATGLVAVVIRGQRKFNPVGGSSESGGTASGSAVAPAITLQDSTGESVLLQFYGHRTVTAWDAAPSGYTALASVATEVLVSRKNVTTTSGSVTQTGTTTNSGYRGAQVEILAHRPKHPGVFHANSGVL